LRDPGREIADIVQDTQPDQPAHGTVLGKSLFDVEALPPGCTTDLVLWFRDDEDEGALGESVMTGIVAILEAGLIMGGRSNRGMGLARLAAEPDYRSYDLASLDEQIAYLDDHRSWRDGRYEEMSAGRSIGGDTLASPALSVEMELEIPRGQDLLVGSGGGEADSQEPQEVRASDGETYWRLPGSSLRGLFRAWVSRLAAREGHPVAYSLRRHREHGDQVTGDDVGWGFLPQDQRKAGAEPPDCVAARLFGSLAGRGRVHITDSLAKRRDVDRQVRRHVAIDRTTGGANEGALFKNAVLTGGSESVPTFRVTMQVKKPTEDEARWLAQAIRALDLGIIRVGSSKASGRLSLARAPVATGPRSERFEAIQPFTHQNGGQS